MGTKWERALLKGSTEWFHFGNDARVLRNPNKRLHILPRLAFAAALGLSFAVGGVQPAEAQPAASPSKRRVVVYTEGARSASVSDQLKGGLPATGDVVDNAEFRKALTAQGQKLPLGLTITLKSKRGAIITKIGKALESMNADAAIIGFIRPKRPFGNEVVILVVEKGKTEPTVDQVVALDKDATRAEMQASIEPVTSTWASSGGGAEGGGGSGAGGDEKQPDEKKPDEDKPPEAEEGEWVRPKNVFGHEIFSINASFDIGGRFFRYNDPITTNLRDYSVFGAPGISARAEVYPLAPLGILILKDLGLTGEFRMQPGISSETSDGTEVETAWMRFGGGLRFRLPVGDKEKPFVFGLRGGFVQDGFVLSAAGDLAAEAPSVKYNFMRVGLDARFPIGPVAITAFGGYMGALDAGEVKERFTEPSIGGIDVGGGLTVPIALGFEARLQAEYVRWFYAFAPVVGDAFVAGGALDEYIHLEIGPQYVF